MAQERYALIATVSLHGDVVEEVRIPSGEPLQVGGSADLAVPLPPGASFLAKAHWSAADKVEIEDGRGERHLLERDGAVAIGFGPVRVRFALDRQFRLRRTAPIPWRASLAWFVCVMGLSVLMDQGLLLHRNRCHWFAVTPWLVQFLQCQPPQLASAADGGGINAEYIARLLRQDYAGEDEGVIEPPDVEHDKKNEHMYVPAGAAGPITEMGGADQTAPEPIRTPEVEESHRSGAPETPPLVVDSPEAPRVAVPDPQPAADEGVADLDDDQEDDLSEDPSPPPVEEEEGWGFKDWMDVSHSREEMEIEMTIYITRKKLAIDPEDYTALGTLAYYQYLGEDFEGAEATYDRMITLFPDDPAVYNNKALIYKRQRLWEKEESLYRLALAFEPGDATAMNNLAVNLGHQGRYDEALSYMDQVARITPEDPYTDLHRAKIHAAMGNDEMALHYLEQALEGMARLDTLHHIEFRQDIRVDPSFQKLRETPRFRAILERYYGDDSPLSE